MGREPEALGEFERMVLLAVLRGGDQAYGVTVHHPSAILKLSPGRRCPRW